MKLHRPGQHVDKFLAPLDVFLLAEHLGEEEHGEAVAVGVAVVVVGSPIRPLLRLRLDEVIDRLADVGGVLALRGGRAFAEQGDAGQGGHRRGIAAVGGGPVAQPRLVRGQPIEPARHGPVHFGFAHAGRRGDGSGRHDGRQESETNFIHLHLQPPAKPSATRCRRRSAPASCRPPVFSAAEPGLTGLSVKDSSIVSSFIRIVTRRFAGSASTSRVIACRGVLLAAE